MGRRPTVGPLRHDGWVSRTPFVPATPQVLRWARQDAGLDLAEAGRLANVQGERVQEWEEGVSQPTLAQLRGLADGLRRPVAFFLAPGPPPEHTQDPPDFRAGHRGTSRALRREIRAAFERRDAFREVAGADGDRWRRWREDPPETAGQVRARLGVGVERIAGSADANAALRVWIDAAEAAGVLVFQMSRVPVDECRGFAVDDADLPVIMLNGADAPQARCFTLVHELAHLLDRTGALCVLDEDAEVEQRCNRFAAAVLMPPTAIRDAAAGRDGTGAVDVVVRTFKVSPVAAALRLRELGLVDQATVAATIRLAAAVARRAAERETKGGPLHHVIKRRNLGDAYLGAVLEALHQDAITILDASYFLDSTVGTVEQMERALAGRPV